MDSLSHEAGTGGPLVDTLTTAVLVVPATAVATLFAARRSRNPIGWLLLAILVVDSTPAASTSSWITACITERCPGLRRLILLADRVLAVKGSVAVAAATLVIAALFNPLRRRVQRVADRRFNRSRYDAEAVVADFNARLRQAVDLEALRYDLLGVTEDAFQPAPVSMWLAPVPVGEQDRRPA